MNQKPEHLVSPKHIAAITAHLMVVTGQDYRLARKEIGENTASCEWTSISQQDVVLVIRSTRERTRYTVSLGRHMGTDGVVTMGEAVMIWRQVDELAGDPGQVVGVFFGQRRLGLSS